MKRWLLTLCLLSVPVWAEAQAPVVNPAKIQWDYADPSKLSRYDVGFYLAGAAEPFWTSSILPAAVTQIDADTYQAPLPRPVFGSFTLKLQAVAPDATGADAKSGWSNASNPFVLIPPVPANLAAVP